MGKAQVMYSAGAPRESIEKQKAGARVRVISEKNTNRKARKEEREGWRERVREGKRKKAKQSPTTRESKRQAT